MHLLIEELTNIVRIIFFILKSPNTFNLERAFPDKVLVKELVLILLIVKRKNSVFGVKSLRSENLPKIHILSRSSRSLTTSLPPISVSLLGLVFANFIHHLPSVIC